MGRVMLADPAGIGHRVLGGNLTGKLVPFSIVAARFRTVQQELCKKMLILLAKCLQKVVRNSVNS
jgi:hypothetical protein